MRRILVLGGGFAGLWAAASAARCAIDAEASDIEVALVNRDPYHSIRVRNYEADLTGIRLKLDDVLGPIGVRRIEAEVTAIDPSGRRVTVRAHDGATSDVGYDRLVIALGSEIARPPIPGLVEHGFDVDTYDGAERLDRHLRGLRDQTDSAGRGTVVVAGAGFTGIEVASEMPARLRTMLADASPVRVVLIDRHGEPGGAMAPEARTVMLTALSSLGVEVVGGASVDRVDTTGVTLSSGVRIDAGTLIWCGGMRPSRQIAGLATDRDVLGRLRVDSVLRVAGLFGVFAAGDTACLCVDGVHDSVMSCQHARPMGRYAGNNAAADLLGLPLLPLTIEKYVTIMDLGPWGALYTEGWDRLLVASGETAKRTKELINRVRIYPPPNGDRQAILDAASPVVQAAPPR